MKIKRILITGAEGFIGRNLKEYFEKKDGWQTLCPSYDELDLTKSNDVEQYLQEYSPSSIIHSATVLHTEKKYETNVLEKNLRMFFNLYRRKGKKTKLINLGSGSEYVRANWKPLMDEDYFDQNVPEDPHSFSKYVMAMFVNRHIENVLHLRLFGIFGKYEDYRFKFISNCIAKNLMGLPISIYKNTKYDYLHVDDFSRIVERITQSNLRGLCLNMVPNESTDLLSIARTVNEVSKKAVDINVINSGDGKEYTGSSKKFNNFFPDTEFTPLSESIKMLYKYYETNQHLLDVDALNEDKFLRYAKTIN